MDQPSVFLGTDKNGSVWFTWDSREVANDAFENLQGLMTESGSEKSQKLFDMGEELIDMALAG